jgi:hypothetical protein
VSKPDHLEHLDEKGLLRQIEANTRIAAEALLRMEQRLLDKEHHDDSWTRERGNFPGPDEQEKFAVDPSGVLGVQG